MLQFPTALCEAEESFDARGRQILAISKVANSGSLTSGENDVKWLKSDFLDTGSICISFQESYYLSLGHSRLNVLSRKIHRQQRGNRVQ